MTVPPEIVAALAPLFASQDERLVVAGIALDERFLGLHQIPLGGTAGEIISALDVYGPVQGGGAVSIFMFHLVGGSAQPSPEDVFIATRMAAAGHVLEIELRDYVIVGSQGYVNLRDLLPDGQIWSASC